MYQFCVDFDLKTPQRKWHDTAEFAQGDRWSSIWSSILLNTGQWMCYYIPLNLEFCEIGTVPLISSWGWHTVRVKYYIQWYRLGLWATIISSPRRQADLPYSLLHCKQDSKTAEFANSCRTNLTNLASSTVNIQSWEYLTKQDEVWGRNSQAWTLCSLYFMTGKEVIDL